MSKAVTELFRVYLPLGIVLAMLQHPNVNRPCQVQEQLGSEQIACLVQKQAKFDMCVKSADDALKQPWDSLQRGLGHLAM